MTDQESSTQPSTKPRSTEKRSAEKRSTKLKQESLGELKKFASHLRITPWTLAIGITTFVALVIIVVWTTGLASYIKDKPPIWGLFGLAFVTAYIQYVGFTLSLQGASDIRLPALRTLELELAESVTYVYTPESVGSLALTMRFLHKQKFATAQAAAATGLSSTVTTVVGIIVLPIAAILSVGTINVHALKSDTPSATWEILAAILGVAVVVTVLIKAPTLRSKVTAWLKQALAYLNHVIKNPMSGIKIAGGELVTLAGEVATLSFLVLATHHSPNIPAFIVVVLIAGTASSVVPIPGGLGAPEAILIAGLNATGVHGADAIICGMSYRLFGYWLPPIPGAICLYDLHRRDLV